MRISDWSSDVCSSDLERRTHLKMIEIQRRTIAGLILDLLGAENRGFRLKEAGLQVMGPLSKDILFRDLAGPVTLTRRLWFYGVSLRLVDQSSIRVLGVGRVPGSGVGGR